MFLSTLPEKALVVSKCALSLFLNFIKPQQTTPLKLCSKPYLF